MPAYYWRPYEYVNFNPLFIFYNIKYQSNRTDSINDLKDIFMSNNYLWHSHDSLFVK